MDELKTYTITLPDGTKTQRALSNKDMALFLQNNSGDSLYDQAITLAKPDSMDLRAISDMDLNRYKELSSPETSVEQRAMSNADAQKLKTYSISIRGGQQQILALTPEQVYDLMRNYGPDASITPVDSSGIGSLRPMR
jgi:hypothetical protein